jgi:hypothetical protein
MTTDDDELFLSLTEDDELTKEEKEEIDNYIKLMDEIGSVIH